MFEKIDKEPYYQVITLVPAFCSLCYHIYIRTDAYKKEVYLINIMNIGNIIYYFTLVRTRRLMRPSCCCLMGKPVSRHFTRLRWETTQFWILPVLVSDATRWIGLWQTKGLLQVNVYLKKTLESNNFCVVSFPSNLDNLDNEIAKAEKLRTTSSHYSFSRLTFKTWDGAILGKYFRNFLANHYLENIWKSSIYKVSWKEGPGVFSIVWTKLSKYFGDHHHPPFPLQMCCQNFWLNLSE